MTKRKCISQCISDLIEDRAHGLRARLRELPRPLRVLIACEESGIECAAYRRLGCEAYHCDILPRQRGIDKSCFISGDVIPLLRPGFHRFVTVDGRPHYVPGWDLIVAHPPCTYLCRLSGVHMLRGGELNESRFRKMVEARLFFQRCLDADAYYLCVENPVPLEMACLPTPDTYVEPCWFGDRFTKKTCYWLKHLPPLTPEIVHPFPKSLVASSRGKYRSKTSVYLAAFQSIQWTEVILSDIQRNIYQL